MEDVGHAKKPAGHFERLEFMILIFIVVLIVSQVCLLLWKVWRPYSYHVCTLAGMCVIPLVISIKNHWWKFLCIWVVFSSITSIIAKRATEKPMQGTTPRMVFKWFMLMYIVSYCICIFGLYFSYFTINLLDLMIDLMIDSNLKDLIDNPGLICMFYGLYYGVMSRDLAEICTEKMAASIGYYKCDKGIPDKHLEKDVCAVCGNKLLAAAVGEKTFRLSCGHEFHEFCIRGWCIVGKKQTCPYCHDKVDLQRMFPNALNKIDQMYGHLLDFFRYLVCWLPIILVLFQQAIWALGME